MGVMVCNDKGAGESCNFRENFDVVIGGGP